MGAKPATLGQMLRKARAELSETDPMLTVHAWLVDQLDSTVAALDVLRKHLEQRYAREILGGPFLFKMFCPECEHEISVVVNGASMFKAEQFECAECQHKFVVGKGRDESTAS